MVSQDNIFKGKNVAEAIENACRTLNVPQEQLDIEVLKTGSSGIFGLLRPKASIRVTLKKEDKAQESAGPRPSQERKKPTPKKGRPQGSAQPVQPVPVTERPVAPQAEAGQVQAPLPEPMAEALAAEVVEAEKEAPEVRKISADALSAMKADIEGLLALMHMPSAVEINAEGNSVLAHISGEHTADVIGPEGRTLDNLQYLLRKIFTRKYPFRMSLSLDAGDFKANRQQELKELSLKMAAEVKQTGKTRAIPSLNPSERRVVHMALQDDKDIRSRSVGAGLFKKVLIYQPGKGRKSGHPKHRNHQPQPEKLKSEE